MVVEQSFEYRPPGAHGASPILIHGIAPYVPGAKRTVTMFFVRVPPDAAHDLPDRFVLTAWDDVIAKVLECFPEETAEGFASRLTSIVPFGSPMP